jgi:hypothetical protein
VTGNSACTRAVQPLRVERRDRVESSGFPEHGIGAVRFGGRELPMGGCAVIRGVVRAVAGKHAAMRRCGRSVRAPRVRAICVRARRAAGMERGRERRT